MLGGWNRLAWRHPPRRGKETRRHHVVWFRLIRVLPWRRAIRRSSRCRLGFRIGLRETLDGAIEFLRISLGTLADAHTTIEELHDT